MSLLDTQTIRSIAKQHMEGSGEVSSSEVGYEIVSIPQISKSLQEFIGSGAQLREAYMAALRTAEYFRVITVLPLLPESLAIDFHAPTDGLPMPYSDWATRDLTRKKIDHDREDVFRLGLAIIPLVMQSESL